VTRFSCVAFGGRVRADVYVALFGAFARALACVRMPDAWVLTVCVRCVCARVRVGVFYDDARSML
jgi:hypothetical protein